MSTTYGAAGSRQTAAWTLSASRFFRGEVLDLAARDTDIHQLPVIQAVQFGA